MNNRLDGARYKTQRITRRQFLGVIWGASFVALVGQFGAALFNFFQPRTVEGGFGGKVNAGLVKEYKPGTVSYVQGGHFYISRLDNGNLLALWQRCTHLGCTVPYVKSKGQFQCPCHGSIFNTKGEVLGGPAPRPMDLFPIEIVAGRIIVDTSQPISREQYEPSQATHA
jgi:cytochrome b6-f complex iron-sulfur subunit